MYTYTYSNTCTYTHIVIHYMYTYTYSNTCTCTHTVRNGVYIYTRDVVYKGVEAHIGCMMWFWEVK